MLGFDRNQFRPIVDSAPLMEVEFAQKSGHGWRGKNTLLLNSSHGSFFFLAEILTTLELPLTKKIVITVDHVQPVLKYVQPLQ